MPKSKLLIGAFPTGSISTLTAGVYTFPSYITFDQYGRISSITTSSSGSAGGIGEVNGQGGITAITSSGNVTLTLTTTTVAGITAWAPGTINVDSTGRVTSIATYLNTSTRTVAGNIAGITLDGYNSISQIQTGTVFTASMSTPGVEFNNLTVNGLMIDTPFEYVALKTATPESTSSYDISTSSFWIFNNSSSVPSGFTASFINVPSYTNRSIVASIGINLNSSDYIAKNNNSSQIAINGTPSPVYWLDGIRPQPNSGTVFTSFMIMNTGSGFSVYATSANYW